MIRRKLGTTTLKSGRWQLWPDPNQDPCKKIALAIVADVAPWRLPRACKVFSPAERAAYQAELEDRKRRTGK
jgi:hypothetical protein